MNFLERLTSLFAPDICLLCRREGTLLCNACVSSVAPLAGICFGCHADTPGMACEDCLRKSGCDSIQAVGSYRGLARQLVASLKFMGNQSAARVMAELMYATYAPTAKMLITHVPATAAHIRERGYDQAALLGKHLARLTGTHHATLLARSGKKHQLGADRHERLLQIQHALRVRRPELIRGQHVLLVDDVLTTGASVRAAAAVLLAAGAAGVDVMVFAQTAPKQLKKTS